MDGNDEKSISRPPVEPEYHILSPPNENEYDDLPEERLSCSDPPKLPTRKSSTSSNWRSSQPTELEHEPDRLKNINEYETSISSPPNEYVDLKDVRLPYIGDPSRKSSNSFNFLPPQPTETEHKPDRLKDNIYKLLLLAFVLGIILALLITIPIIVSTSGDKEHGCDSEPDCNKKTEYNMNLKFDRFSAHQEIFISNNDAVISNKYTPETPNSVSNSEQLETYSGIMGNVCFGKGEKVYYQVEFFFTLTTFLPNSSSELFAEIGLVDPNKVDTHYSVGEGDGWSYTIHNCVSEICLSAKHYKQGIIDKIKTISLTNDMDMLETGKLGFFLNREKGEFSVIDGDTMRTMHTFEQVTAHDKLCPVFGVYDPSSAEVELEILYAYNFTTVPIVNAIA